MTAPKGSRGRDDELDLFGSPREGAPESPSPEPGGSPGAAADGGSQERGGEEAPDPEAPLPARMRPRTLEEFRGQDHLLGPDGPLRLMLEEDRLASMILWGPPGSGKTTLARILARRTRAAFVPFSAVTEGVGRVREIIAEAGERLHATGRRTILFCDEIHRFNRGQQDAFLPHVEEGTVVLVGATTENPSFEVNRPLLSRAPVFILAPLEESHLRALLEEALRDRERGLGAEEVEAEDEALDAMARAADGDARRALGVLEGAAGLVGPGGRIDAEAVSRAIQHRYAVYDKAGEEHYNLISALHKAVRGSDPDGALYWLARMLAGGEDPLYVARRLIRMASEDVGLADPEALRHAVAARESYETLGSPEGELALAQAAVHLATAPKSNRLYVAWKAAARAAKETPAEPVPMHIRNAPNEWMREWGYGEGYRYDPDEPGGVSPQGYLPDALEGRRFYEPGPHGHEPTLAQRMQWWEERRRGNPPRDSGVSEDERSSDPGTGGPESPDGGRRPSDP